MRTDLELYGQLVSNCKKAGQGIFYFVDISLDDVYFYRIINYRLARYSDFCLPKALEMRGIMFLMKRYWKYDENEMDYDTIDTRSIEGHKFLGVPIQCVARPMEKFFNYKENPFTESITSKDIDSIEHKMDGSLISSYRKKCSKDRDGIIFGLKSKCSLISIQAVESRQVLDTPDYAELKYYIEKCTLNNLTVNMEYTSPTNLIVLNYKVPELTVLNVRNNITGEYEEIPNTIREVYGVKKKHIIIPKNFLEDTRGEVGIEGYVCVTDKGQRFKIKTDWYIDLHKVKFELHSNELLFKAVVNERTDDLVAAFKNDTQFIDRLEKMNNYVSSKYSYIVEFLHKVKEYSVLERKLYVSKVQELLTDNDGHLFTLAMQQYDNFEIDYKEFLIKSWKKVYRFEFEQTVNNYIL